MNVSWKSRVWGLFVRALGKPLYFSVYHLTGVRLKSDTYYEDWTQGRVVVPASAQKVQALLPSPRLKVIESSPGKTTIYIDGNHMRKVLSLPPYEELSVYVPVTYQGSGAQEDCPHVYFLTLPVSIEAARWGGAHLLGMPKFVAPIHFTESPDAIHFRLEMDGQDVIRLDVPKLSTRPDTQELGFYGVRDGQYVRSRMHTEGLVGVGEGEPGAQVFFGDHPRVKPFHDLEIETAPIRYHYMEQARSRLYAPDMLLPL